MNAGKSCRGQSHAACDCRRRRYRATCRRSRKRRRATTRTVLQKPDASTSELGLQVYPAARALKQAEAPQLASRLVPARRRSCVQPACLSQWKGRIPATNQQERAGAGSGSTHRPVAVLLTATAARPLCEFPSGGNHSATALHQRTNCAARIELILQHVPAKRRKSKTVKRQYAHQDVQAANRPTCTAPCGQHARYENGNAAMQPVPRLFTYNLVMCWSCNAARATL